MSKTKIAIYLLLLMHIASASTPPPRQQFLQYEGSVWWGAEFGLNRYKVENELWANVRPESVTDMCFDENILWLGTDRGLFWADLRYLDWKEYTKESGLPADSVVRVVADVDYIYAAGPHGLARFDKLVEQWEPIGDFSDKQLYDLYSDQTHLWVATDSGVYYFDKQFEKWQNYNAANGVISNTVYRTFLFSDYLWAVTDMGFSRYNSKMKTWNSYPLNDGILGSSIDMLFVDASYIWIICPERVVRFSAKNQTWENFSKNMPIEGLQVNDLYTSGTTSWFATSDGIFRFEEDTRRWTTYTAVDGLSDDVQERIFTNGQTTICRKGSVFSNYRQSEDVWRIHEVAAASGAEGQKKWKFHSDETGLGVDAPGGQSVNILGRAYMKVKNKAEFPDPVTKSIKDYVTNTELDTPVIKYDTTTSGAVVADTVDFLPRFNDFLYWWPKAQLNLNADFKNNRTLRGSFDNTDPLGELRYGMEYRGFGDDHLRRLGWKTDQENDFFYSTLIDPTYLEGAGVRTEFGGRVGEKKRRRVNTGVWAGWRKTEYMRKLIPFQEDNFYELNVNNIITESVEIKVDGKVIDPMEYSIERTMGLLTFRNEGLINPDSRIEISFEYQPDIEKSPAGRLLTDSTFSDSIDDMVTMGAAENVVVISDAVSVGVTGAYRGFEEPDRAGTAPADNRLVEGSANGRIELKSDDGKVRFLAIPEVSTSYNDSILVTKQGTGTRLGIHSTIHNLKLKGLAQYHTPDYVTLSDISSVYGRLNSQLEGEAVYEVTQFMPITLGAGLIDSKSGGENRLYFQYLLSPSNRPSIKLFGMHQGMSNTTKSGQFDSLKTERWNARLETEMDIVKDGSDLRFWLNGSYDLNFLTDSLLYDSLEASGAQVLPDTLSRGFSKSINHNMFAWMRFSPHKKVQFESKNVFRVFQGLDTVSRAWVKRGNRLRPQLKLYSQEFIPGITLYGKYEMDLANSVLTEEITGRMLQNRFNSNVLAVPGVWWGVLNPLQMNLAYNFSTLDSLNISTLSSINELFSKTRGHAFTINPILQFTQDIRFSSRSEISRTRSFDELTGKGLKIYNEAKLWFRERRTKLFIDYDVKREREYLSDSIIGIDTTLTEFSHEFRYNWIERWTPNFRTELPIGLSWEKLDTTSVAETISSGFVNGISPAIKFDFRFQRTWIREFRTQYTIGFSLYEGKFLRYDTYKKSWDNKLDVSVKAGKNFFIRLLLNISYLFDENLMKYDMAELKATALF